MKLNFVYFYNKKHQKSKKNYCHGVTLTTITPKKMKNQQIVEALQKIITEDYHFSDYEIQKMVKERRNILIENYKDFAQKLIEKLSQKNTIVEVGNFIKEYVEKIKTELYFRKEYKILIVKLNEISYWFFGNCFPLDYYNENKNTLRYWS